MKKYYQKIGIIVVLVVVFIVGLLIFKCSSTRVQENKIVYVPLSKSEYENKMAYNDVEEEFKKAGFINVKSEAVSNDGWLFGWGKKSPLMVKEIKVNEEKNPPKGKSFDSRVVVEIYYYEGEQNENDKNSNN